MTIQQQLLQKFGDGLVKKFQASIAQTKATGRTSASIHATSGEMSVTVWGAKHIGALEYGRQKTKTTTPSTPTLFEAIKEWALAKGIISGWTSKERSHVYFITKKIHEKGTLLHYTSDYYKRSSPSKRISGVIDEIDYGTLMRELSAIYIKEFSSEVIKEIKTLQ